MRTSLWGTLRLTALFLCLISHQSFAQSIGINFVGGQHSGGPDGSSLLANDSAGVIPQMNWNNVGAWSDTMNVSNDDPRADGMATNLVDDSGTIVAGFSADWESDNTYASLNPMIDNADEKLMDGYIDISGTDRDLHVNFTGIPYASYDAYIYVGSDGLFDRKAVVTVNDDPNTSTFFIANTGFGNFTGPSDYVQATATNADDAFLSTYVFYQGLVGADASFKVEGVNSNAGIHGIQLVESFDLTLKIDPTSGAAELRNDSLYDIDFDLYEIGSTDGYLDPSGFNSLQDQDYEGNGAPGTGNGWEELGIPSSAFLGEAFLTGSSILTPGTVISLGDIFTVGSPQDNVTMRYHNAETGVTRRGIIEYGTITPGIDCDFDDSGMCDAVDIDLLVEEVVSVKQGNSANLDFDINGDGTVDNDDLNQWLVDAGAENTTVTGGNPYLTGDANLDGNVNGQDFVAWNAAKFTSDNLWSGGDWNADGVTDGQDFVIWNSAKFTSSSGTLLVPEPTFAASGLFLLGLVCSRRRS